MWKAFINNIILYYKLVMPFYSHFLIQYYGKLFIRFSGKFDLVDTFLPPNNSTKSNHDCIYLFTVIKINTWNPTQKKCAFYSYNVTSKSMWCWNFKFGCCYNCIIYFITSSLFGSIFINNMHFSSCFIFFKLRKRVFLIKRMLKSFKNTC